MRIKDFRSFFGEHEFDLSTGVNYFVGPNNCGKSNFISALELALNKDHEYVPLRDRPAKHSGGPAKTRITLTFEIDGKSGYEATLRKRAREYERAVRQSQKPDPVGNYKTYADDNELRMVVTFSTGGVRTTSFQARGLGAVSIPAESREHKKLEEQFWKVMRLAVVHSGEDIETLLQGRFQEILHLVISEHLAGQVHAAEKARGAYLEALRAELLQPLRERVETLVSGMFPEIEVAELIPDVPSLSSTLSSIAVQLGDAAATTDLKYKGTGVRGAVLLSLLQYLAEQGRRSLVLAVEEPEAFLHPGGQEHIREHLEELAARSDVTLLVTTHSPYVISRKEEASLTELRKRLDGGTEKAAFARGSDSRAELLGALYRDAGMASVLDRALAIPTGSRAVLITEGYTDEAFLRYACAAASQTDLLAGIHVINAEGAAKVVLQAVLASSATELPVVALLDMDDAGKKAAERLEVLHWNKNRELLSLKDWPGKCDQDHDVEIEDLIPARVIETIVARVGETAAIDRKVNCRGRWHYALSEGWKVAALQALPSLLSADDATDLIWLAEEINKRIDRIVSAKARRRLHVRIASSGAADK